MKTTSTTTSPATTSKAGKRPSAAMSPVDLEALADALMPIILARLAGALGAAQAPYSTRKGGPTPPEFVGRGKRWRTTAPTIPGAVRIGRWVSVDRDCYRQWLAMQSTSPSPTSRPGDTTDEEWTPRRALEAAGIRLRD